MIKLLSNILLLFVFISIIECHNNFNGVFVDPQSTCTSHCGSYSRPYPNILTAVNNIKNENYFSSDDDWDWLFPNFFDFDDHSGILPIPTIFLKPGLYNGDSNKEIIVSKTLAIKSLEGKSKTVIDCEGFGGFVNINSVSNFEIDGVTIRKCKRNFGAALNVTDSVVSVSNCDFIGNMASFGGAISSFDSRLIVSNSKFSNNIALENGVSLSTILSEVTLYNTILTCSTGTPKDVYAVSTNYVSDSESKLEQSNIFCSGNNNTFIVDFNDKTLCNNSVSCLPPTTTTEEFPNFSKEFTCNNDTYCDPINENCMSCPGVCDVCKVQSWKLETFSEYIVTENDKTVGVVQSLNKPTIENFASEKPCPVSGRISGYFKVPTDGYYTFRVKSENMAAMFNINNQKVIDFYYQQDGPVVSERSYRVSSAHPNFAEVYFFSSSANTRNISLEWKQNNEWVPVDGFFSLNICGDGIFDPEEDDGKKYPCQADKSKFVRVITPDVDTCGDGICNEVPEKCISDCYSLITPSCPGQAPPYPSYFSSNDTIGTLLNNQYLFSLPGIHHLRHGVNLTTGAQVNTPLFTFSYCDDTTYSIVQDFYRGLVYTVPRELFATSLPQCSYDARSSVYSETREMSSEMAESHGIAASASISGGAMFVKASLEASYSQNESVEKAKKLKSMESGKLIKTEIKCVSSKVHFNEYKFSQGFLKDVSKAVNVSTMVDVIRKYGSYYYKSATLGGTVAQLTVVKSSSMNDMESIDVTKHAEMSFQASLSARVFSVSAGYSNSIDSNVQESVQNDYVANTTRTTVISKGGPPGSFNPSKTGSGDFVYWAQSVDLLPVPVDYQLGLISQIIPASWTVKNSNETIKKLWENAEDFILTEQLKLIYPKPEDRYNISRGNSLIITNLNSINDNDSGEIKVKLSKFVSGALVDEVVNINIKNGISKYEISSFNEILSVESTTMSSLSSLLLIDYSFSRVYQFTKSNGILVPRFQENQVSLHIKLANSLPNTDQVIQIVLYGSKSSFKTTMTPNIFNSQNVRIDLNTNTYIGTISGVSMKLWNNNNPAIFSIEINSIFVTQSCPSMTRGKDSSGCTPSSLTNQKAEYSHYYFGPNNVKLTLNIQPEILMNIIKI
ncbi:hypothetical protein DLAC_02269 [Tieghemostelium lacteum]|uniref:MACPF domain-containing protein n=1 Tax=Tieghemostelium lacteum TaxID=361077 RepID=A0A152A4J3_TIELA|nr:hypothetical protein DLAC_02269 [Tieghemostelium lacteum]|eukprot:KYR01160.1 hypothetical protein DLAC_02269 [Tieghemostelium lacteum]